MSQASQVFQVGTGISLESSTIWGPMDTGGVLLQVMPTMLGVGTWIDQLAVSTGTTSIGLMVFLAAASGIN